MPKHKLPKYQQNDLDDYEINFFEIFKYLWHQKILIIFITALVPLMGAAYISQKPLPPVTYQGIGLVEIGTYINNNERIVYINNNERNIYINDNERIVDTKILPIENPNDTDIENQNDIAIFDNKVLPIENPNDIAIMIRHGNKIWASLPDKSEKMLKLETMSGYVDASTAKNYIQETIDKLILRHEGFETVFASKGAEQIFPTTQIGEIKVNTLYPKDNRRGNVILLFFAGIILSFLVVGIRYLMQKVNKV